MEKQKNVLEVNGVTIYVREDKWYWMIKSKAFDSAEEAFTDALEFFKEKNSQELHTL